ncbi:MAG: hypothetical protein U1C70_02600 [Sediminibacterium sp.]|uniref:WD40 repeat domain-containing protein n=1 Tax=Sediminibacterium sp. TaxID=1917865 RepID=UPI002ABB5151|nr:hypothetical protein [Sediminibacterium sp.]MDZ4070690.1 hypothetical protein [Sediminibacterium sp.]
MQRIILLVYSLWISSALIASPGKGLWTVAIDHSGRFVVTGGDDQQIRLYQYKDLKLIKTFPVNSMIRRMEWQPNGQLLAVATGDKKMHLRNMVTGDSIPLVGAAWGARGVSWSYNGKFLAATDNHLVKIWNEKGELIRTIAKEDNNSYLDIDWHPSKNVLLVSGDDIRMYDMSGKKLAVLKHREEATGVLAVEWHPNGLFFVSGDYGHEQEGVPTLLQFWTTEGKLFKTIKKSKMEYRDMKWNHDGSLLATASDRLRVWDREGNLLYTGGDGKHNLWGVVWNPFAKEWVTVSFDGTLDKWSYKAVNLQHFE